MGEEEAEQKYDEAEGESEEQVRNKVQAPMSSVSMPTGEHMRKAMLKVRRCAIHCRPHARRMPRNVERCSTI